MKSLLLILLSSTMTFIVMLCINAIISRTKDVDANSIYSSFKTIINIILLPVPLLIYAVLTFKSGNIITTLRIDGKIGSQVDKMQPWQAILLCVWILGIVFLSICHLIHFYRWHKTVMSNLEDASSYEYGILDIVKEKLKCTQSIRIYNSNFVRSPISMGIKHPIIVLPESQICKNSEALTLILEHEIYHIMSKDLLHRVPFLIFKILFWFNPLVYICFNTVSFWCELATDDKVVRDVSEKEKQLYAFTILSFIPDYKNYHPHNQATMAFSFCNKDKKDLKRRISYIMKRKGDKKVTVVLFLAVFSVFVVSGTLSVYAANSSNKTIEIDMVDSGTSWASGVMDIKSVFLYATEGDEQSLKLLQPESGHEYYILKDGQQIPWDNPTAKNNQRWGCQHEKVFASVSDHAKYSDGSCLTIVYDAQYCTKCGSVWKGEESGRMILKVCPH